MLIRDREDKLCLQCHDQELRATDGTMIQDIGETLADREFLHGPIRDGQCSPCHNVHGASHSRLLNERFTEAFYASYDLKNYALCFDCHVQNLVQDEETTALTDFRDGDRNLHYVHVHRAEKGRTCRTCHEIHGSNIPRHIAESVPFEGSGWALPIRFQKLENGGSCAPGCHEPMTYAREAVADDGTAQESEGGAP
jgi:predicted CXXCH cytochrome family protein